MKTMNSTPFCHFCVPWSTRRVSSSEPPSTQSDTATVITPATVIMVLRRSETQVSRAKYEMREYTSAPDAVDAARLIAHERAVVELDDPATHRVDDARVVGGHDDRGAGPVDAVEQPHDADGGLR